MIRHMVMFSLRAHAQGRDREANLPRVVAALGQLGSIPGVLSFEVGENANHDAWSDAAHVALTATFADWKALAAYKAHPLYAEAIAVVRPLREQRWAADFEVGGPAPGP